MVSYFTPGIPVFNKSPLLVGLKEMYFHIQNGGQENVRLKISFRR